MMFSWRPKVEGSLNIISSGTSFFYETLVAEEAKECPAAKQALDPGYKNEEHNEVKINEKQIDKGTKKCIKEKSLSTLEWRHLDEVQNSKLLESLTRYELKRQEAKFEIITTEIRYLNSLNEGTVRYFECKELSDLCTDVQWKTLFGNIQTVKAAAEMLLSDLVSELNQDIMMRGIYSIIWLHTDSALRSYTEYCRNSRNSTEVYLDLMKNNAEWKDKLIDIQMECPLHNSLQSYLLQPIQRIARLPLLLESILSKIEINNKEYTACKLALNRLKELAGECNKSVGENHQDPRILLKKKCSKHNLKKRQQFDKPKPTLWTPCITWNI